MKRRGMVPWPTESAAVYRAAGYWLDQPLGRHLWDWAGRYGDRTALVDGDRRLGYRQLAVRVDTLAENLLELGLRPGQNVLVQLPNCWQFLVTVLACARVGLAPVLALPAHRRRELVHVATEAEATAVVVPASWKDFDYEELAHQVADACPGGPRVLVTGRPRRADSVALDPLIGPADGPGPGDGSGPDEAEDVAARRRRLDAVDVDPEDVAFLLLSGGTTGLPKLIGRTHNDYEYNARRSGEVCGFGEDTVYLAVLPVAHNFPLACPGVLGTWGVGGRVVMAPSARPEVAFPLIARERVNTTAVVPAVAQRWLQAAGPGGADLSSLRQLQVGGARLAPELARRVPGELGCALVQVFGMAEGLLNYTRPDDPAEVVATTQGRPISPHDEILIVDEDGAPVAEGESGELLTRGPYTPPGYFRGGPHNKRAFTPDGWYRTGDVVRVHPSGNLVVAGRSKDLINRGGEKISAEEVEDIAYTLPQVVEAAAIAVPDEELGERICLCVVLKENETLELADVVETFSRSSIARYKFPEHLRILPSLPHTPVGKIDKKALRAEFVTL
ncbi:(2,3-dihydroxybenzoyl)adenylate synthase [Streptomyces sp.]|uniref:(2,3-dihydroxybenzoyl)adenylate synthase n=1 Tax=Streptomyces sp. TaxID=1931 RepID=UPI002D4DBC49|nr:AMP-binding protein [Streptomyces sp.]HZF86890.1 AMP-binding protein [Streptomyces sp.]